jgi:hypothetical protein
MMAFQMPGLSDKLFAVAFNSRVAFNAIRTTSRSIERSDHLRFSHAV